VARLSSARGGLLGQISPLGVGPAQAAPAIEVIDGGKGAVDSGWGGFGDRLQVRAVVADGPVAGGSVSQRVAIHCRASEPGQELTNLGKVGATGFRTQGGTQVRRLHMTHP
jgi:hypothetical protein